MKEVTYIKADDGWKRIVEVMDDVPEAYKDNHYYRSLRESRMAEIYQNNTSQIEEKEWDEKEMKQQATMDALRVLFIMLIGAIVIIIICGLIILLTPGLTTYGLLETIAGTVVVVITKLLVWFCNLFQNICFAFFDWVQAIAYSI